MFDSIILGLLFLAQPSVHYDDWVPIASMVRVGDGERAEAELLQLQVSQSEKPIWSLLLAEALLCKKQGQAALEQLDQTPSLDGFDWPLRWLRFRATAMAGLPVAQAASEVMSDPRASVEESAEAELALIDEQLKQNHQDPKTIAALKRLMRSGYPTIQVKAAERLANLGDPSAISLLLIKEGATAEGQRVATSERLNALTPEKRAERAKNLFKARAYELARPDFQRLLNEGSPEDRQEAASRLASTSLRLFEHYDDALQMLDRVRRGPNPGLAKSSLYSKAMVLARQERYAEAEASAEAYLKAAPKGDYATEARFLIARSAHRRRDFNKEIAQLEALLATKPKDKPKWRWFLAWAHLQAHHYPQAQTILRELSGNRNLIIGPKALYWLARSYDEQGKTAERDRVLNELLQRAPDGYYGILGAKFRAHLQGRPFGIERHSEPISWPKCDLNEMLLAVPESLKPQFEAMARLIAVGQIKFARSYESLFRNQIEGFKDFDRCLDDRLEHYGARWKVQSLPRLPWVEGALQKSPGVQIEAYPQAYLHLARAAGHMYDVSPWWLLAHMLQESRFKERQISGAGALGLLQILPRTGHRIAAQLQFPQGDFYDGMLSRSEIAIRYAAWYLSALRADFGGSQPMAIASYNGGPRRMAAVVSEQKHLMGGQLSGFGAFEQLIEEIDAHETRNYVRKVTDHAIRFAWLYGTDQELNQLAQDLVPNEVSEALGEVRF